MAAEKDKTKCGMVAIVGRPNVGKSTLLNRIVGEKIAIVSKVPQTTRQQVRGIYTDERGQIIFIDTPGLHLGKDKLDKMMNQSASGTLQDADAIVYLVDTSRQVGEEERNIAAKLSDGTCPVVLGLNKIDIKTRNVEDYIALIEEVFGRPVGELDRVTLLPLSGTKGNNVDELINILFDCLPEGPLLYEEDVVTDVPQKQAVADIIREKLFMVLDKEIPHSLGVMIEAMDNMKGKTVNIKALIFVERDTQKEIVIGKKGEVLKKAGTLARKEIESLIGTKVFLECHVKTRKRWRDDVSILQDAGYEL